MKGNGMKNYQKTLGRIMLVSAGLCWGLAGVCVKSITWSALAINPVRCFISIIVLLLAKRSFKLQWTKKNILGAIMSALCGASYLVAIKLTTAGTAIVLQYVAPVLVFLYEVIFKGRKPKAWQAILTACVFLGIVLSFSDNLDTTHILGNLIALFSGFMFAGQIIVMNGEDCDAEDCAIMSNLISILIGLPFLLFDGTASFDATNLIWLLILGVFQYGAANLLFAKGCKKVDSVECSILIAVEPVFNPIPVAIFCHEMMGPRAIIGAVFVVISIVLYSLIPGFLKKRAMKKTS